MEHEKAQEAKRLLQRESYLTFLIDEATKIIEKKEIHYTDISEFVTFRIRRADDQQTIQDLIARHGLAEFIRISKEKLDKVKAELEAL